MTWKDNAGIAELQADDFKIQQVGEPVLDSPLQGTKYISDRNLVSYYSDPRYLQSLTREGKSIPAFEMAGPRKRIFHDPAWTKAAIVTCGGLCPGLNDVIKAIVNTLHVSYGVHNVIGIRYGFRGLAPCYGLKPVPLDPDSVDTIHENGGSILGSSRGQQETEDIVQSLHRMNVNVLFCIGGDGTLRAAGDIADEAARRKLPISVVGVPKTIDNDVGFMERTFGFETAVYTAAPVISCAHDEAKGTFNGIGLVKLMGRHSGFIAASSVLANSVANFCLIPEVPFELNGPHGFLTALKRRLTIKDHAVVVVAEGAGQEFFTEQEAKTDASGNVRFQDIGVYLKERIDEDLSRDGIEHSVKYFDPSYMIRSVPAHGTDAIFCLHLAQNAVHAAMAGRTSMVAGYWHGQFTHVPISLATHKQRRIDPQAQLWQSVLQVTAQSSYWS